MTRKANTIEQHTKPQRKNMTLATQKVMATIIEQGVATTTAALLCLHASMRLFSVGALINLVTEKSGGSYPG